MSKVSNSKASKKRGQKLGTPKIVQKNSTKNSDIKPSKELSKKSLPSPQGTKRIIQKYHQKILQRIFNWMIQQTELFWILKAPLALQLGSKIKIKSLGNISSNMSWQISKIIWPHYGLKLSPLFLFPQLLVHSWPGTQ